MLRGDNNICITMKPKSLENIGKYLVRFLSPLSVPLIWAYTDLPEPDKAPQVSNPSEHGTAKCAVG